MSERNVHLSRRRFLATAGTMLALPALDSLVRGTREARADPMTSPIRFLTFHIPIGVDRSAWNPSGSGSQWQVGTSMQPLAPHQGDIVCITGVNTPGGQASHTCGAGSFLTGVKVEPGTTSLGTSADQHVASFYAGKTPLRSLELGTAILNENPNNEAGFSPVCKDHLSWNQDTPLPKEISPQRVFDRLFAGASPAATDADAQRRKHYGQSVIDTVRAQAKRIQSKLGARDVVKLDQYLTAVRELELRIGGSVQASCQPGQRPAAGGVPSDIRDHVDQMLDLMVLAVQCDMTRVVTFGYEHTVTERTHPFLGVNAGYHIGVTHCGSTDLCDAVGTQFSSPYVAINTWLVSKFARLVEKLKAVPDGAGTLLDQCIVYFASELGDGSLHSNTNIPIVIAGRAGGKLQPGRLLDRSGKGNGNVLVALMQLVGVPINDLGMYSGGIAL
jgi:hypothetical protein